LLGGTQARRNKAERLASRFRDGRAITSAKIFTDKVLPCVGLVPCRLFRRDDLLLEIAVGPPVLTILEARDRLSKQLIAVPRQRRNVDDGGLGRPETPTASLVLQVGLSVGGANETTLSRVVDLTPAVARAKALDETTSVPPFDTVVPIAVPALPTTCDPA
jgi:hypothetical protein